MRCRCTSVGSIPHMYREHSSYYMPQGDYKMTSRTGEDISALRANDPADKALYAAAKLRFWSDVQHYAVTPASCRARGCSVE